MACDSLAFGHGCPDGVAVAARSWGVGYYLFMYSRLAAIAVFLGCKYIKLITILFFFSLKISNFININNSSVAISW